VPLGTTGDSVGQILAQSPRVPTVGCLFILCSSLEMNGAANGERRPIVYSAKRDTSHMVTSSQGVIAAEQQPTGLLESRIIVLSG